MIEIVNSKNNLFNDYYNEMYLKEKFNSRFRDKHFIEYHNYFFKDKKFIDDSFCVLKNKKPQILFSCFTVNSRIPKENPAYLMSSNNNEELKNKFFEYFNDIFIKKIEGKIYYRDFCLDKENFLLDYLIKKKKINYDLNFIGYLQLENDTDIIWNKIRYSYRSIIKKNKEKYKINLLNKHNIKSQQKLFDLCLKKYKENVKIGTRTNESWNSFKNLIISGNAHIIVGLDKDNQFLGYISSTFLSDYSYYASSLKADNSSPIIHILIWENVKILKKLGIKQFELGICKNFKSENIKLENIFKFKKGFCSNFKTIIDYEFK